MAGPQKFDLYQMALRHLGDARLAVITDDVTSRYALDDAWDRAVNFVLGQAAWRFALITEALTVIPSAMPGYGHAAFLPVNCLRPHAIFLVTADGRECPFDLREQGVAINFNITGALAIRHVSTLFTDPGTAAWPEHFAQLLAAYLAFLVAERVTGDRSAAGKMSQLFSSLLPEALTLDAVPEDFWLPHQRSGAFYKAARHVIGSGNWDFGLTTLQLDPSQQSVSPADTGWPYRYDLPSDHLRTQALYVPWGGAECPFDIRETKAHWSTATGTFTVRYLSTAALDASLWPEPVTKAVAEYLEWQDEGQKAGEEQAGGVEFQQLLAVALARHAIPEDLWLRFQRDGRWRDAVGIAVEKGRWRFGIATVDLTTTSDPNAVSDGSVSPGYAYRFLKPNDWLRTIWLHRSLSDGLYAQWCDVDYRDELDAFHANYSPIRLRYVSRLALDSTRWAAHFREAVRLYCLYMEASVDPKQISVARERFAEFAAMHDTAETLDDEKDVPRMQSPSRFVSGRYGRGTIDPKQGWPP